MHSIIVSTVHRCGQESGSSHRPRVFPCHHQTQFKSAIFFFNTRVCMCVYIINVELEEGSIAVPLFTNPNYCETSKLVSTGK